MNNQADKVKEHIIRAVPRMPAVIGINERNMLKRKEYDLVQFLNVNNTLWFIFAPIHHV